MNARSSHFQTTAENWIFLFFCFVTVQDMVCMYEKKIDIPIPEKKIGGIELAGSASFKYEDMYHFIL